METETQETESTEVEASIEPTCPKCSSTAFKEWPIGSNVMKCSSCDGQFHPSDLTGERFAFLKAEYAS